MPRNRAHHQGSQEYHYWQADTCHMSTTLAVHRLPHWRRELLAVVLSALLLLLESALFPSEAQQDDAWAHLPRGDFANPPQSVRRPAGMPKGTPMAAFFQGRLPCLACGPGKAANWQDADDFDPARFMACRWCNNVARLRS